MLLLLSVAVGSALLGYRWSNSQHRPTQAAAAVDVPEDEAAEVESLEALEEPRLTMPDLHGLSLAHATEALADVGLPTDSITIEHRAWVGDPGRVVDQDPPRRSEIPDTVTLVLSEAATVPDVQGKVEADAISSLAAFGAVVRVTQTYDASVPVGTVISVNPAPGQAMAETMELEVSSEPTSVFLSQISSSSGSCSTGDGATGSESSANAMTCSSQRSSSSGTPSPTIVYPLNGRADRFTAIVGIDNSADPTDTARVIVQADGADRFNETISFSSPVALDIELTGVSQLRLFVLEPDDGASWGSSVVFIEPSLLGSPESIVDLIGQP